MSILSALHQQHESLDDLAKLPQSMIMQMAQRKQISPDMVAPILSRKSEMMDAANRSRALMSAQQQGAQPKPTIMEGLMAKNSMAENPPQQGIASIPTPEREYAGGGIVAFSEGDYVDDEDAQDEQDFAEQKQMMEQGRELADYYASKGAGPKGEAKVVSKERVTHAVKEPNKKHPYGEMVERDAVKYGNDPKMVHRLLNIETGGMKNPESAVSSAGAQGIAQFMPATAKQYGIDPFNPREASRGMNEHVHHLMKKYGDPQLVAIAYNWGEGNTNKWLARGADPSKLPKETQTYLSRFMSTAMAKGGVVGYAKGGKVERASYEEQMQKAFGYKPELGPMARHYMSGGEVRMAGGGGFDPNTGEFIYEDEQTGPSFGDRFKKMIGYGEGLKIDPLKNKPELKANLQAEIAKRAGVKPTAPVAKPEVKPQPQVQKIEAPIPVQKEEAVPTPAAEKPTVQQQAQAPSEYDEYIKMLKQNYADSKKNREADKNMAIIAAGLGMMAGDSPYAAVNIGKGALVGLQQLSESKKLALSDEANSMKTIGAMMRYKEIGQLNKEASEARREYQKGESERKGAESEARERNRLETSLSRIEDRLNRSAEASLKAAGLLTMDTPPEETMRMKQEWVEKAKAQDPSYKRLYKQIEGFDYEPVVMKTEKSKQGFRIVP